MKKILILVVLFGAFSQALGAFDSKKSNVRAHTGFKTLKPGQEKTTRVRFSKRLLPVKLFEIEDGNALRFSGSHTHGRQGYNEKEDDEREASYQSLAPEQYENRLGFRVELPPDAALEYYQKEAEKEALEESIERELFEQASKLVCLTCRAAGKPHTPYDGAEHNIKYKVSDLSHSLDAVPPQNVKDRFDEMSLDQLKREEEARIEEELDRKWKIEQEKIKQEEEKLARFNALVKKAEASGPSGTSWVSGAYNKAQLSGDRMRGIVGSSMPLPSPVPNELVIPPFKGKRSSTPYPKKECKQ